MALREIAEAWTTRHATKTGTRLPIASAMASEGRASSSKTRPLARTKIEPTKVSSLGVVLEVVDLDLEQLRAHLAHQCIEKIVGQRTLVPALCQPQSDRRCFRAADKDGNGDAFFLVEEQDGLSLP
jgi:hypothetical protein